MRRTRESFPSEREDFTDSRTGRHMIRWTASPALDRHLYFTSQSVTADDRWLVFLSERDGHPNFYAIRREDGTIHRVTENQEGSLRSYVYPSENRSGLGKSSPSLDAGRNILYYVRGAEVWRAGLDDGENERLFQLPEGWWTAFSHVSADGRWLCVPCSPPEAFPAGQTTQWEQLDAVPAQFAEKGLKTRLYVIDTQTGDSRVHAEIPFWVTHVNYAPDVSGRMVINSEGMAEADRRRPRIWCVEANGDFRPLFDQPAGMQVNHENWTETGELIVYHGGVDGCNFVAARDWAGNLAYEYRLPGAGILHATPMKDPRYCVTDRANPLAISQVEPGEGDGPRLVDLCMHDSPPGFIRNQDAHPHPLQTPDGKGVVFTSSREGACNVYEVRLSQ